MAAVTQPSDVPAAPRRSIRLPVRDISVALAIAVIWIVVLLVALLGPDIVSSNAGTSYTRLPSVIVVVFFAYLATHVIAKTGFGRTRDVPAAPTPPADTD
jgi:hypothetical protein